MRENIRAFVGKTAPDFTAKAVMPDNTIEQEFNLKHYIRGHKCVLFFYPLDFTFVCPSEIIAFNNKREAFAAKNTKIVGISIDSCFTHLAWKNTPYNKGGIENIQFPLVSDINKTISEEYNVLHSDGVAVRGTFIIDENFIIRQITMNDASLGRNVVEVLRIIDAIDYIKEHGVVCPAGWDKGKDAIIATQFGVADYLASNAEKL